MQKRILLVEDEEITREGVAEFLREQEYEVLEAEDGEKALQLFRKFPIDIIVLDVMLPKLDGFQVLHEVRKESRVPVLMLTAMSDEKTQIMSFDEQADDYMSKPFSLLVLEKRIAALLRRTESVQKTPDFWTWEDTKVDFVGFAAYYKEELQDVKPKEIKLLRLLTEHMGQVLTREQILDQLWSDEEAPLDRVVDVYIKNLRKKLHLTCIKTVKGVGYKIEQI